MQSSRQVQFEILFREHSHRILAFALRRGATRTEAEEVVAETFLTAWRRLEEEPRVPIAWLLGIARKVLANRQRSQARHEALLLKSLWQEAVRPLSDGGADGPERGDSMIRALAMLGDDDREVVILVAWDGLSHAEAAQVVGCSRNAFTIRFLRARRRLMKHFDLIRTHS